MLEVINKILIIFTNLYGLYFIVTALSIFKKEKKKESKNKYKNYFSILIPARNEEKVIANLINSLNNMNYDKDRYEINVILNNSKDNTYNVSTNAGANVLRCKSKITTKGEALKEAFRKINDDKIDAYIIFDADNVVDKDFLKYMNESINNGYKVAQGFRDTKNNKCNWISSSYTIYYFIQNLFYNKSRKKLNRSTSINGTGFMIKKEVIDTIGFNVKTLSEDVEFTGICALNDIKIDFVEKAVTYDEQASDFKISWIQRKRWSKGCLQCYRNYFKSLIKKSNKPSCLDMLLIYFAPILQILSLFIVLIDLVSMYNNGIIQNISMNTIIFSISFAVILYLLQVIVSLYSIYYFKRDIKKYISGVFLFPVFLITWLPINIVVLFRKNIKWEHIEHSKSLTIEDM